MGLLGARVCSSLSDGDMESELVLSVDRIEIASFCLRNGGIIQRLVAEI